MRWSSRLVSAAGIAALSLGLASPATAASWPASGGPGLGARGLFGIVPAPGPRGPIPYFQLAVAPGQAVTATALVENLAKHTETLALDAATGVTASNSGNAYLPPNGRCSGAACWVSGLPSRVTLPAGAQQLVSFTVRVPRRAALGQYLSGITAMPATRPAPVKLGTYGGAATQAVIIDTVTVAMAVTVGDLSSLMSRLSIHGVQATDLGPLVRLDIGLYNTGQTFAAGKGQASCRASGQWHSYPVYTNDVLPGGHAVIAAKAQGLPEGTTVPCAITLRYGKNQVVSWSGPVAIPAARAGRIVRVGKGAYALVPPPGFPRWGIALIVICALLAAALLWALSGNRRSRWH